MPYDDRYPRPQLVREEWVDLCGPWAFGYDDSNVGLMDRWQVRSEPFDRTISVPFPPESAASGINDKTFHPVLWYRRKVTLPERPQPCRWLLHFGAVDFQAEVWVVGQLVASHVGGHVSFSADVTNALSQDVTEHVIVVRAEDSPDDVGQPRGKQHWEADPVDIWFHRTSGIWQPVWLEPVPLMYIDQLRWTPDPEGERLGLAVLLNRAPLRPLRLDVRLTLHGEFLAYDTWTVPTREISRDFTIALPTTRLARERLLWSPEHPNLIEAEISLVEAEPDAQVIDHVSSYAGLRSCRTHGGRFLLNGVPYYLRMALEQGYWPESHLAAPSPQAIRREVELAKELGFNGLRLHQKVEDPRFLAWCDRLGMLVWGEMANAYAFSADAVDRFTREWLEVVRRDVNHPSIVTWVPFNESWGVFSLEHSERQQDYVRSIYHLTRAIDPTRPVIGNDGWEHFASDIWGIHDYALDRDIILARYGTETALEVSVRSLQPYYRPIAIPGSVSRGEPIMLTECGGIEFVPGAGNPDANPRRASDADDFLRRYGEFIQAVLDCAPIQGFCYTELTDVEQEKVGLLDEHRQPKADIATLCHLTQRPTPALPAEQTLPPLPIEPRALATARESGGLA